MNHFGRLIVIFATVLLIFVHPLLQSSRIQNRNCHERAELLTKLLLNRICSKKELTKEEYEKYLYQLSLLETVSEVMITAGNYLVAEGDMKLLDMQYHDGIMKSLSQNNKVVFLPDSYVSIEVIYSDTIFHRIISAISFMGTKKENYIYGGKID